ncbi:methyltransferase-like protein 27 isoform X2 [Hyla sarda]|uniref:methyltransferase-like protein 27 isoform X2 n=1 Tax=Hyla sarda TaxID=327740 RepID=UPI0024C28D04|nr:methyltransferase-like protein 27 isoform X2 [Hyla sarda]
MANCEKGLQQVRDVIAAAHEDCSLLEKLQFYDRWSTQYEEDVSILDYKAPHLAALALASVCQLNRESKLVLDVACGTGRAAEELQRCGFNLFHGLDGSAGMLEVAKKKGLYQQLKQNMLGQTQFPYDSGGFVCMTTRCNISNLRYKAKLEEEMSSLQNKGLWEQVLIQEVEQWEKATSEKEITHKSDYIPGVIYIYRKMLTPSIVS